METHPGPLLSEGRLHKNICHIASVNNDVIIIIVTLAVDGSLALGGGGYLNRRRRSECPFKYMIVRGLPRIIIITCVVVGVSTVRDP